ncbi:tRNA uridine-5-carboxymethylaminomethyl(34) synthesis GTPase MnmE ['Crotalaria aegyptiaca' phytoplasma]|uniref:tRNA modification GTPase MnmE n=1 Tax=Candidatus Phytoplasma crotalariae TaxID=2982627 RepID=A0ABT9D2M4_9MOLU|nr:tRNA uridine-5-carboxymethylaminomethyl(34) synthesis GTPase MnmE ['Crotalaria aegyptiaca' phytoplasma]MDO8059272.1 tRNA uridine-5-carboxymethylaminomethyl(34) synthesis GTPase MnmE ['Crotalaria aegyptiaca' phytoplasma]
MFLQETIAAIATPLGVGSISVIRVSGSKAIEGINSIFKGIKEINLLEVATHTIHHGFILNNSDEVLDEVLISVFRSPRSFTGEDIIEIQAHGGTLITKLVLERVLSLPFIRLAEPGEFSKRAFLNKKIDLLQAEAIMDLIHAKNIQFIKLANAGLQKKISKNIQDLNKQILNLIVNVEVNIDYPEYDDIPTVTNNLIVPQTEFLINKLQSILDNSYKTRFIKEGIKTLILGKPNVGKSSLLNNFLGEERAIVSDVPGTTRDFLDVYVTINGINLRLIDTAGIRNTDDYLENLGVNIAKKFINEAELILLLLDAHNLLEPEDLMLLEMTKHKNRIIVGSKSDLSIKLKLSSELESQIIFISNHTQEGIENLKRKIIKKFNLQDIQERNFDYLFNLRQVNQLKKAIISLENILKDIKRNMPIDIHVLHLKEAYQSLENILGSQLQENLINELFSKFCLGK